MLSQMRWAGTVLGLISTGNSKFISIPILRDKEDMVKDPEYLYHGRSFSSFGKAMKIWSPSSQCVESRVWPVCVQR